MEVPLTITKEYKTDLTKLEITNFIEQIDLFKKFEAIEVDEFFSEINGNIIKLQAVSYGIDLVRETHPLVTIKFVGENPTVIVVKMNHSLFYICFFSIYTISFLLFAVFSTEVTINEELKKMELIHRFWFIVAGIVPTAFLYFRAKATLKKMEEWLVYTFDLEHIKTDL